MFDTSICLISCFPVGVFLEITQGIYYHQTNYSYFFPIGFFKGIKELFHLKINSVKRGSVIKTDSFDLIKCSHHGMEVHSNGHSKGWIEDHVTAMVNDHESKLLLLLHRVTNS